jgi:uridine kinase
VFDDDDLIALAKNPLLARLARRELETFASLLDQVAVNDGSEIVREGDEGDFMYFVLSGHAHIRRGETDLGTIAPGQHFGELALIGVRRRAATVTADGVMRMARLSRGGYRVLAAQFPVVATHFLQALVASLRDELVSLTDNVAMLLGQRSAPRRTEVHATILDRAEPTTVRTGTPLGALLPKEHDGKPVVAALLDARPVSLSTLLLSDARIGVLTLGQWEGREALRRSAGLVLIEAAHRVAPGLVVQLGQSVTGGRVVLLDESVTDREALRANIEREAQRIVRERVPFREEVWTIEEAKAQFRRQGWDGAASLLSASRATSATLISCGDLQAISIGPTLDSTGQLDGLSLLAHPQGFLLDYGEALRPYLPAGEASSRRTIEREQRAPRFSSPMSDDHVAWLDGMGVSSVGAFNDLCVRGEVSRLIRIAEGFHEKQIGVIADQIAARGERVKVISIAGPSSSGKTTFIKRLSVQLEINGIRPVPISLDDYYVDREKSPRDETGGYDFESLYAINLPLLHEHLRRLRSGEQVATAKYDFLTGRSLPDKGPLLQLQRNDVLLLEGIHGLNPELTGDAIPSEEVFRVFIHPATTLPLDRLSCVPAADVRLLRRIVRDRHSRGYKASDNINRWSSVRRGELQWIYPFMSHADAIFDSSLAYEPAVLKVFADRYLLEVTRDDPAFATAHRLRKLVDQFVAIYPDHVPPTSIAREFIGGSGFEY